MKRLTTSASRFPCTFLSQPELPNWIGQRSLGALSLLLALATSSTPVAAQGSPVTFTSRLGTNVAYCGPVGEGPAVQHNFTEPVKAFDTIAVQHPGGFTPGGIPITPSMASSRLDALPSKVGFTLFAAGEAARDPLNGFGVYATADTRDFWTFTVSTPIRFRCSVIASVSSSESQVPIPGVSYSFSAHSGGAQILPDPGTSMFYGALSAPGTLTQLGSGVLLPGTYQVSLQGRTESNYNSYPFSGSFLIRIAIDFLSVGPATPSVTGPPKVGSLAQAAGDETSGTGERSKAGPVLREALADRSALRRGTCASNSTDRRQARGRA